MALNFFIAVSVGLHHVLSLCPSSSFHYHPFCSLRYVTSSAIGVERFGHAGRPCSQHLASLPNLLFDKGVFKWGMCVLQCSVCGPLQPWGSLGTGGPYFVPSVRMLCEEMELSYPPSKSSSPSTIPIPFSSPFQPSAFQISFPSSSSFWR